MAYIYDLTDTWNASGTTFNGIKLNVTDSASASSSKLVTLQTNGTEHFSITKAGVGYVSGNLGVGTASPAVRLDVNGAGVFKLDGSGSTTPLILRNNNTASTQLVKLGFDSNGAIKASINAAVFGNDFMTFNVGSDTERMRINSSGNVGIGTSSPGLPLNVTKNGTDSGLGYSNVSKFVDGSGNKGLLVGYDNAAQTTVLTANSTAASSNMTFWTYEAGGSGWAERMRIAASGNVGIGTTSPGAKLTVIGSASKLYVDLSGDNYYDAANHIFRNFAGTERARINSSGFLLVGTTAPLGGNTSSEFKVTGAGSWPLTLNANDRGLLIRNSASSAGVYAYFEYNGGTNNGQISFSGGTTSYVTTSDARVKKNIVDAPDAGALIDAIKVRSWDFKVDDMHWRYGMVAQELISIAPEAVTVPEDEDKMMGIDYSKLVPMLIKEVQSLRARVAQLEGN